MCTGRMKEAPSLGETPMAVMLQPSGEVGMVQQQLLLRFVKQIMTGYNRRAVKVKSYVWGRRQIILLILGHFGLQNHIKD